MIAFLTDEFVIAWLFALTAAGAWVLHKGYPDGKRILWCFVANWLMTATVVLALHKSPVAMLLVDALTVAMLVKYGKSKPAYAVAVLFSLIIVLDNMATLGSAAFSQVAAGSDLLGFIGLIIMAGAENVDAGKHRGAGLGYRRLGGGHSLSDRGAFQHGAAVSRLDTQGGG